MSDTLVKVTALIQKGEVLVSIHGYDELAADGLLVTEIVNGIANAVVVEDYPTYHKGPAVLVLQEDAHGNPIHIVWGIAKGTSTPAVVITAYRPDPNQWSKDFTRRKA
jgi:hypothetical protein